MAKDKLDSLTIEDTAKEAAPSAEETVANASVPAAKATAGALSPVQEQNQSFEGLGDSDFPARVVLDGNQILFKDEDRTEDSVTICISSGRKVYQFFDEDSNTYYKSYDGKFTEEGEPVSNYPGMRHMFELDWIQEVDGEEKEHQLVLSPTSRYAFVDYAKKLAKIKKSVADVDTIITAIRKQNADGQRYSQAQFTCKELM